MYIKCLALCLIFIHSFIQTKHIVSICSNVLGFEKLAMNKVDLVPALLEHLMNHISSC